MITGPGGFVVIVPLTVNPVRVPVQFTVPLALAYWPVPPKMPPLKVNGGKMLLLEVGIQLYPRINESLLLKFTVAVPLTCIGAVR